MIEFIKSRKRTILAVGSALIIVAAVLILFITIRGCSAERVNADGFHEEEDYNPKGRDDGSGGKDLNDGAVNEGDLDENPDDLDGSGGENETIPPGVTDLKVLKDNLVPDNNINILILGEDKLHQLMDTIGIISINKKSKKIKIIMIPRDTYIQYNHRVLDFLGEHERIDEPGVFKINYSYFLGWFMHKEGWEMDFEGKFDKISYGVSFMTQVIEEKFDIAIHDFIRIDTEGFVDAVDLFGGVEINVPYDMNYEDPYQDLYIHLEEGVQLLDGEQAEGFVRFRTGIDEDGNEIEYGDFERKRNQINFLKAFFEQHGTIANINRIPEFLQILGRSVWTSISFTDMLFSQYTGLAVDIIRDKYEFEDSLTITGNTKIIDGTYYIVIE